MTRWVCKILLSVRPPRSRVLRTRPTQRPPRAPGGGGGVGLGWRGDRHPSVPIVFLAMKAPGGRDTTVRLLHPRPFRWVLLCGIVYKKCPPVRKGAVASHLQVMHVLLRWAETPKKTCRVNVYIPFVHTVPTHCAPLGCFHAPIDRRGWWGEGARCLFVFAIRERIPSVPNRTPKSAVVLSNGRCALPNHMLTYAGISSALLPGTCVVE